MSSARIDSLFQCVGCAFLGALLASAMPETSAWAQPALLVGLILALLWLLVWFVWQRERELKRRR